MFILVIIGIILSFPVAKGIQIVVPSTYGLILPPLLGFGLLIVGAILVIKDRKSLMVKQELVSNLPNFFGIDSKGEY